VDMGTLTILRLIRKLRIRCGKKGHYYLWIGTLFGCPQLVLLHVSVGIRRPGGALFEAHTSFWHVFDYME